MARKTYYIEISGSKLAWDAPEDKYKNIAGVLGIKVANNSTTGLIFGANRPRMARVRLNFDPGLGVTVAGASVGDGCRSSQIVFCALDKVKEATYDGQLKGKLSNGRKIKSASLVGVMT